MSGDEPADAGSNDSEESSDLDGAWHRRQAVDANNSTWELLDGRSLVGDDLDQLLERAYAAAHHWRRAEGSGPVNRARASWLLSRAHAVAGHGELALHHAERCAEHTADAGDEAADFDHAFQHEARARALACLGRMDEARAARDQAVSTPIADDQDREIVEGDLASEPWFGLDAS